MKKHGAIGNKANPYFAGQVKKRRAKNKVAKASRKANRV